MYWVFTETLRWLESNIQSILILGVIILVGSVVRFWFVKPNRWILGTGVLLLFFAGIGGLALLNGTPEKNKDLTDESERDDTFDIPDSPIDRLRLSWDSEDPAYWPAAETLAELSDTAYLPPFNAEAAFRTLGFTEITPFVQGSMIGYVITGNDVTVVVFRGTDFKEMSDWMANLNTSSIQIEHGAIHKGFYNAYRSMKDQIDEILSTRDTTHLWITGHSLGGALALACAYDSVVLEKRQLDGVITFGQPMIARRQFADFLDERLAGRYARFVNRDDIVPKVPPNFEPCGSLVWFVEDGVKRSRVRPVQGFAAMSAADSAVGDVEVQPLSEEEFRQYQARLKAENEAEERLPDGTPMQIENPPMQGPVDDHMMFEYITKIRIFLGINTLGLK